MKKVVLIGTGNLAWHLGPALKNAGFEILQILGRNAQTTKEFAKKLEADFVLKWEELLVDADFYFLVIPDQELSKLKYQETLKDRFFIHCSGATPMEVIRGLSSRIGVLYPLQTFSKNIDLDFSRIPLCLEASHEKDLILLTQLAETLSEFVYNFNSAPRAKLHVSAVFANNFTNHLFTIAEEILKESDIPFQILFPIIAETVRKVFLLGPEKAQTGPALRNDQETITKHLEILQAHPDFISIYKDISGSIQNHLK